jgi:hypothetical protein
MDLWDFVYLRGLLMLARSWIGIGFGIEHGYCEDCLEFGLNMAWKIGISRRKVGISEDIQTLEICLSSVAAFGLRVSRLRLLRWTFVSSKLIVNLLIRSLLESPIYLLVLAVEAM